ncbi:MAG: leucine-rich repeat domain-containing protein [Deltaproteobacteria bacterium]|jgi:hypothetical protein|nr:leucine-rich repeat domain-containing protein [Deltaproteobacteria bacterium]
MSDTVVIVESSSVNFIKNFTQSHPEGIFPWEREITDKVVLTKAHRSVTVEEGRLVRLDMTDFNIKGQLIVKDLEYLKELYITGLDVSSIVFYNIPELEVLFLEKLSLTPGYDALSFEGMPSLKHLRISSCGLWDLEPLEYVDNVEILDLHNNKITNIDSLVELELLVKLDLSSNEIEDLEALEDLIYLEHLDLSNNMVMDLSPLAPLVGLTSLWLSNNPIDELDPIMELTDLTDLRLSQTGLLDLDPISELTNLNTLHLAGNELVEVKFLSPLSNLTILELGDNELSDLQGITHLTKLERLGLAYNQVEKVEQLKKLTALTDIDLSFNYLENAECLKSLKNLTTVDLSHNQLTKLAWAEEMPELKRLFLTGNHELDHDEIEKLLVTYDKYVISEEKTNLRIESEKPHSIIRLPDSDPEYGFMFEPDSSADEVAPVTKPQKPVIGRAGSGKAKVDDLIFEFNPQGVSKLPAAVSGPKVTPAASVVLKNPSSNPDSPKPSSTKNTKETKGVKAVKSTPGAKDINDAQSAKDTKKIKSVKDGQSAKNTKETKCAKVSKDHKDVNDAQQTQTIKKTKSTPSVKNPKNVVITKNTSNIPEPTDSLNDSQARIDPKNQDRPKESSHSDDGQTKSSDFRPLTLLFSNTGLLTGEPDFPVPFDQWCGQPSPPDIARYMNLIVKAGGEVDEEEAEAAVKKIRQMFMLLNFNPSKFSIH